MLLKFLESYIFLFKYSIDMTFLNYYIIYYYRKQKMIFCYSIFSGTFMRTREE